MKRKHFIIALMAMLSCFAFTAKAQVAEVGNTKYATIDEAISKWTNGTTLTLLQNVTLSDVVVLKSTEHHILNLGTYTMTAASGKNAFVIKACGTGDSERTAITINADAANPGGIYAGSKCVVYYKYADGGISGTDRPIIMIKGGVFTGSTSSFGTAGIYTIGTEARKCATLNISGGTFNCSINGSGKSKLIISSGVFNYSVGSQGDKTAYRLISGGKFKTLGFMTADGNNTKFWFGTSMANSNVGLYVDDEGYLCVGGPVITELSPKYKAVAKNATRWSSYLAYSSAATNGLYYTNAEAAIKKHGAANVTVYEHAEVVEELDNNAAVKDFTPELPSEVVTFEVEAIDIEATAEATTKVTFNVEPKNASGAKVSDPSAAITFRLPVPAAWSGKANVYHEGTLLGAYTIKEESGAKYVEVSSANFSEFAVEAIFAAKVGETPYATFAEAAAAAQAGSEIKLLANIEGDITVPANVTLNGNEFAVSGTITADGTITFAGVTKAGNFGVKNVNTVVNIPAGASLQLTGTGRMVIGHGCTFNITGTIADNAAKTTDKATLTPSLVMPGASFTGAGVTFNVTNAYISAPSSYCSSSKSASGTFDFNITNSIWENAGKFAFESQSTAATVNFDLVNSVLNTGSHLVFGVSRGEVVIDNSNVNVGKSNQIENQSTMTIKNGSVVNGSVATSSNAKNPGTIIVEDATYAVTGEFSGSDLGTGTLIIKKGATVSAGSITKANITVDAEGMTAADEINLTANLSKLAGELSVINNDKLEAQIVDGKVVLAAKPVAKIGEQGYATLEAAFAAATEGQTITMLDDATPALTSQRAITKAAVIDLGGKTMTLTEDDLYFGTTTFKNGTIVVDPSVKPSTAVFWMFANQTLTFDNVKIVATGVTGTYLIGLEGENSDLNLLNGSEILVENTTALDLDIICVNASTGNDIKVENSKVNVTNLDGRVFFRGNYTVKDSEVNLAGITKAGFRIEAGQTLSIEGTSNVNIEGELRDGGIHMTDLSAIYTKADDATVNATVNEPKVAKVGENTYRTLAQAVAAVEDGGTITLIANETFTKTNRTHNSGTWYDGLYYVGDKSFTIDLGDFTISQDGAVNDYLLNFKNSGSKANTITLKNGTIDAGTAAFCAICTSSSQANELTINTEKINIINNISNGSTIKLRGGAVLNVKDGTKITGKNSYLGIECVASTVNIYDGAEIYMNGTSSYNGCLVGACAAGTVNVYGGYGKGVRGGFIAMTSGGTINIEGGEWIANTDGTVGNNSNLYVLTAQSNKYESGFAGASIINVTGGTFRGGMDAWVLNNVEGEKAELNIIGGTFNANPASYVAENSIATKNNGVWTVAKAAAKVGNELYASLEAAFKAATSGCTIDILSDVTVDNAWDARYTGGKFTVPVTINGNGKTIKFTASVNDNNYQAPFRFEADATVKNLTIDMSEVTDNRFRAISSKGNLTVDGCKFIGKDETLNCRAIIFGEGAGANVGNLAISITNSEFINWKRGITDNENAQDVKTVTITDNKLTDAGVGVSAKETVTFTGNTVAGAYVNIKSYTASNSLNVVATGNTLEENTETAYNVINAGGTINAQEGFNASLVAKIGEATYGSLQVAVNAVKNGETITLTSDVTENVTLTEKVGLYYTIDGAGKTMDGSISVTPLSDTEDNRRITIKNINFVNTADAARDFISSVATNHYPRLTVEDCTFTGNRKATDVAVRLKSSHSVVIKNCTATGMHSFIQNTSGWNLTIEKVTVTDSKSGFALGTVQGVTVKGCEADVEGYGIRLDAQYNNNAVIESNKIKAFIPVVVRKAEVNSNITVQGTNEMTATNTDGLWMAVGTSEYEENGQMPTAATAEVVVTLNDATLSNEGIYGDHVVLAGKGTEAEPFLINDIKELVAFRNSVNAGETRYSAPGVWVALAADIDMAGENWVGIGTATAEHGFMGNFDGKTFKFKNLTITNPALDSDGYAYAGLFGVTEGTDKDNQNTIKNLTIENVTITTTGHIASAAIAYPYYTIVDNVKVCGNIAIQGGDYTAGVLAYTRRCVNASNLSIVGSEGSYVKGNQVVGGVISDIQMNGGLTAVYKNFSAEGLTVAGAKNVGGISGIIATQTLDVASVKNVTLNCSDAGVGIVAGCLGGTSTISNVTYENVTGAATLIGATYNNSKAVAAKIGNTYYASLEDALAAKGNEVVELLAIYEVAAGETKTLDLNGKTVTMVYNQKATKNHTMISNSGNLTIQSSVEGGKLSYTYAGENLGTTYSTNTVTSNPGSVLTVKSGTIENLTFDSGIIAYAIDGLTNGGAGDVTVNIEGGVITSKRQAVRIFANSTTNTGALNIEGGEFTGRVIVQNASAKANKAALNIISGTFNANEYKSDVLYVGGSSSATIDINATVSGGTFNGEITETNVAGFISGGTFANPVAAQYCAAGFIPNKNTDGTYGVVEASNMVATTNGFGYATLAEAIKACVAGDNTIELLANCAEKVTITQVNGTNITINGNGKTYTGTITIKGDKVANNLYNTETLTFQNINFAPAYNTYAITAEKNTYVRNITVDGCTFKGNNDVYGINARNAYNYTVKNTTAEGMYTFFNAQYALAGLTVENVNVKCASVAFSGAYGYGNASFKNVTVESGNNGIKVNNPNSSALTFENCSITAKAPVTFYENAGVTSALTAEFNGTNTMVVSEGGTYWFNIVEADATDATFKAIVNDADLDMSNTAFAASVGNVYYSSLQKAIDAAVDGDVVTLAKNIELDAANCVTNSDGYSVFVNIAGKAITIDLNGKAVTANLSADQFASAKSSLLMAVLSVDTNGNLTLNDSKGTGKVAVTANDASVYSLISNYDSSAKLTINGGSYELDNARAKSSLIHSDPSEAVVVNGGNFYLGNVNTGANGSPWIFNVNGNNTGHVIVNGGTYNFDVAHQYYEFEVSIDKTFAMKNNGNGTWTVVPAAVYVAEESTSSLGYTNYVGYVSVADALAHAKEVGMTDLEITIIGTNDASTTDNFDLVYTTLFENVTIKQDNGGAPYYFYDIYTGIRANDGKFLFDGVNIVVTDQYMFEGNVELTNNSVVKSVAAANCFVYYANVTVEAGSKIDGVIEDIRGGSLIIDGGKTDGTYSEVPGLSDAILVVNWTDSKLVLQNGAYVKINSANEVGQLTVNGTLDVLDSKLDSYQWITVNSDAVMNLNIGSIVTTKAINGAGKITVDATNVTSEPVTVISGDMTGFTGTIELTGNEYAIYEKTNEGLVIKSTYVDEVTFVDGEFNGHTNENDMHVGKLTYIRKNMPTTWTSIYLPFEVPVSVLADQGFEVAYINGVRRDDKNDDGILDEFAMETIYIHGGESCDGRNKTLKANYPYFIRTKGSTRKNLEITLEDWILYAAQDATYDCTTMTEKYEITGNSSQMTIVNKYGISGGGWTYLNSAQTLKPFRFYMLITSRENSEPVIITSPMRIVVRGEELENGETLIYDIEESKGHSADRIFDLQGRRVLSPVKGNLYIINGKKVVY